jgi:hypothetical protein
VDSHEAIEESPTDEEELADDLPEGLADMIRDLTGNYSS